VGSGLRNHGAEMKHINPVVLAAPFLSAFVAFGLMEPSGFLVVHVATTGQSLSIGHGGSPDLTTTALGSPYGNLGWTACGTARTTATIGPLAEPDVCGSITGEGNVEDLRAALGNTAAILSGDNQVYFVSEHGISGVPYHCPTCMALDKSNTYAGAFGDTSYNDIINSVTVAHSAEVAAGNTYRVGAIVMIHGETDSSNGVSAAQYEADLVEYQGNLQTDIEAITGQSGIIPLITGQMSDWTSYTGVATMPGVAAGQLQAALDHPQQIMLLGPEYVYATQPVDGIHLLNTSYRALGGLAGQIVDIVSRQGKVWVGTLPTSITVAGSVITAQFHVPAGSLVCDTTTFTEPVSGMCGFEFHQTGPSPPSMLSAVPSGNTVTVTLSGPPSGTAYLAYAKTGTIGAHAGPATGPRGNLRDSDTTTDQAGDNMWHYAPSFDIALPYSWTPPADAPGSWAHTQVTLVHHK
jgi:hypothetical protein